MINVAILGFGVVGSGVAKLITENKKEVTRLGGDDVNIKYVLDLRDFPDSPFADKVIHDYSVIVNDPDVSVVIEVMGGSHPAYEYTVAALKAGKSVITSNKEVVANFGDEFLALAKEMGVCYRFEAAVGGGIPVISPMISCIAQNKINEVRGILNGTTNYILTQMFTYGQSFDTALSDAQRKGYAESNPDADILGTDACRKTAILTALISGKLLPTASIHTEGITKIRDEDVSAASKMGATIKLVGRGMNKDGKLFAMVAPFIVPAEMPLSGVSGVYNAVEVIAEPLGNVMFYGQGAGAGATASAVVGDLMQVMASGVNCSAPEFEKSEELMPFGSFESKHYLALCCKSCVERITERISGTTVFENGEEYALITPVISESELESVLASLGITPKSNIRILA